MKNHRVTFVVLFAVLLCAAPVFAGSQLVRYHADANFNCPVGATFDAWWPCQNDWSSWGTTSNYREIIDNWDDCEENPMSTSCWIYDCGQWVQVTCP
jgi:hypothetical protein